MQKSSACSGLIELKRALKMTSFADYKLESVNKGDREKESEKKREVVCLCP